MAGFDYGNLARAGAVWCTDAQCSSGGWSDPRVPEDENCPGYGGDNKTATYAPALVCNGVTDVQPKYSGGFGAPAGFEAANFGSGSSATGVAIPEYSRASPLLDEARGAAAFGINSFRVPFRIEYVAELWEGTWMADGNRSHPEYVPPYPHYLQMVVDYVEAVLTTVKAGEPAEGDDAAAAAPISVVFDMHNYQRWCPMGIGGTWSCLEEAASTAGKIPYSANAGTTSCPLSSAFPDHAAFEGVCPKKQTPQQAAHYWDAAPDAAGFAGTPDYGMEGGGWTCPLDVGAAPPPASRLDTCGDNNKGSPKAQGKENPYAKVLGGACWGRIWTKLLDLPVSSKAFPGQCVALHRVLGAYSDESKPSIAIGLMNEPNMVDTAELAAAYKGVVTAMRSAPYSLENRLLVMGNYWGGLHAQVTPEDRSATPCGAPASTSEGHTAAGEMPLEVIHKALADVPQLGKWTYEAHQYLDYFSTGNWDCGHGWPADKASACAAGSADQVRDFVNWAPFINYTRKHDISVAITEFGGHPSARCNNWIDGFLQMMEEDRYVEGQGGVIMWQLWRVCPHTSWYTTVSPTDPSADCVQFAPPTEHDSPTYAKLWAVTSADGAPNGLKPTLKKYVQH
jgi:hypothetical protein